MARNYEEDEFEVETVKEEDFDEDDDEMSTAEKGFLDGYEKEMEDPFEEREVVEEEMEY